MDPRQVDRLEPMEETTTGSQLLQFVFDLQWLCQQIPDF